MKTRILGLVFLMLTIGTLGFCQSYSFKVLANKGSTEYKSGEVWQPIKTGSVLRENDEVKLAQNSYLGLVSSSGKALEVKTPGIYPVKKLTESIGGGTSVLQKYTDFILSSNSAEAKKNRLSATGAVHRAPEVKPIHLLLPENQHSALFNTTAIISWENTKIPGPYVLTVMNMFDDVLDKIETAETNFIVNFANPKFAGQSALIIQVNSKTDTREVSKQHLIKRLSPSEQENIRKSLEAISSEVSEPTALNKLILAGFYEENRLLIDAITSYEEAIKLAPDVPSYQEAFDEFLLRNNIMR
jgi:hypothetical protein